MNWQVNDFDAFCNGDNEGATDGQISLIEFLKETCTESIEIDYDMTMEQASELIEYLKENQIDRINAGLPYNQTDILNKLKREVQ